MQIVVSVGLLVYLFWRIGDDENPLSVFSEVIDLSDFSVQDALWLLAALLLTFLSFVIGTLRWESAVDALGMQASFRQLFPPFMAGQFTSNFLPTTIGGDILRVTRLNRISQDAPKSFGSVVLDRLGGWIALPLICLAGLVWNPGLRQLGAPSRLAAIVAVATLGVLALLFYLVSHGAIGRWLERRQGISRYMHALHLGFDGLKGKPRDAGYLVLTAVLYQFSLVLAIACAAEALHLDSIGLTSVMVFLPVVLIVQALPISVGGLGVREGLFVFFFTKLGVTDAEATLLGLLLGAMVLVCSLPGVAPLVFDRNRRRNRRQPGELPAGAAAEAGDAAALASGAGGALDAPTNPSHELAQSNGHAPAGQSVAEAEPATSAEQP